MLITGACASVGKPGYGIVRISFGLLRRYGALIRTPSPSILISQPLSRNTGNTDSKCDGMIPVMRMLEPVTAAADISVAATMRSGIIACTAGLSFFIPSITTVLSPAPCIFAPQALRKSARSTISGSRAALLITVVPFAVTAAIMIFSVAPTDGIGRAIFAPWSSSLTEQSSSPCSSQISIPISLNAPRCRSIGLGPSSHPPGKDILTRSKRAIIAPRKMIDERMRCISSAGISKRDTLPVSTMTVLPSRRAVQPM